MDPWRKSAWEISGLQNSYDVTVTSFLNQSQQTFVILLEILRCTFVANLSKIDLFIFPWQNILETALIRNGAIQLSNYVTVTLFLNQSQQTFVILLEILSCTFVANLSKITWFMFSWQHILEKALMRNGAIQLSNYVTVTLFLN